MHPSLSALPCWRTLVGELQFHRLCKALIYSEFRLLFSATGNRFFGRKRSAIGRGAPCGCPSWDILASRFRCDCLGAARGIRSAGVTEALAELMVPRGVPDHIRSDNGPGCAQVAWAVGSKDALHRAWVAVGERLHRAFQRAVGGRSAGQGALLFVVRGGCANGAVQADLQPGQAAQLTGPPAAGAGGPLACRPCPRACRTNITGGTNIGGRSYGTCNFW